MDAKDIAKNLNSAPVYAAVGAADLVLERVRDAAEDAVAQIMVLASRASATANSIDPADAPALAASAAKELPGQAVHLGAELIAEVTRIVGDLTERGENLVVGTAGQVADLPATIVSKGQSIASHPEDLVEDVTKAAKRGASTAQAFAEALPAEAKARGEEMLTRSASVANAAMAEAEGTYAGLAKRGEEALEELAEQVPPGLKLKRTSAKPVTPDVPARTSVGTATPPREEVLATGKAATKKTVKRAPAKKAATKKAAAKKTVKRAPAKKAATGKAAAKKTVKRAPAKKATKRSTSL